MGHDWDLINRAVKVLLLNGFEDIDIHDILTRPISMDDADDLTDRLKKEIADEHNGALAD
jgi:hypothetical protein